MAKAKKENPNDSNDDNLNNNITDSENKIHKPGDNIYDDNGKMTSGILSAPIVSEMRKSYLDYAMSVITSRALPDARDGLKPVHRRILFAMHKIGLTPSAKFKKSAAVVGDVLAKYHPHGDASVYDAMVKLAQDFATRYPLVYGQGNFGSIDGDGAAAMRYTESKMSKISTEILRDIEKETVNMKPNYDGSEMEPVVMPTRVPNLLLNGTLGIAVGMATDIPPHNLREIIDATNHLIENKNATNEDLCNFVQGPDFPTGGIAFNRADIMHAYATGRGGIVTRGEAEIVETKNGQFQIIITSIPYRVVRSSMLEKIAELVNDKKIEGIKDIRDESAEDTRIVIELRSSAQPEKVLNYLYKHTQLENNFNFNIVALVKGVPQTLSLKDCLSEFIEHRKEVVRRRTEYDLRKAREREHILIGLKKALDHIDEIIALIKKSSSTADAHEKLMKKFDFSAIQATAILEMKLSRLAALERQKIEDELMAIQKLIKELTAILESEKKMLNIIKDELGEIREKFGDERKTIIVPNPVGSFNPEDLIAEKEAVLVYTKGGYIKRTDPEEFRTQKRGGVGVVDLDTKEEDFVQNTITGSTHADILFFTDKGRVYQLKMYDIPEGKRATRGKNIMNFLQLTEGEKIASILEMPKDIKTKKGQETTVSVMMITQSGQVKKCASSAFSDVRRSGIIAIRLDEGDALVTTLITHEDDSVILTSREGQSIRFFESDVRQSGRTAGGVSGMKLGKNGDLVVGADIIRGDENCKLLVLTSKGYGKMTDIVEYKIQNRGGSGIKTVKVTDKTGDLVSAKIVREGDSEILAMSKNSIVIKTTLDSVPTLSRDTQGVKIMSPRDGDEVVSLNVL